VFSVVSAKAFERVLRKGGEEFVLVVDVAEAVSSSVTNITESVSIQSAPAASSPALSQLLEEFSDLFQPPTSLPPLRAPALQHRIRLLPNTDPPARGPYRLTWAEQRELQRQLAELLEAGLIVPSTSPFAAPVLLVKKKDGTFRLCVDYRLLNKATVRDRFPLPLIQELLDRLRGAQIFTKLDLKSGYFQLRMAPHDEECTAFVTPTGTFQFRVLPMGLSNAPATFQRAMQAILRPLTEGEAACVAIYLDDLLVYSRTLEEHAAHLRAVFAALRQHDLRLHPRKCEVGVRRVVFLGHTVEPGRVSVEEDKVAAVRAWRMPRTRVALQRFLGFCNFYRAFVPEFAKIATPLTDLLAGPHTGPSSRLEPMQDTHHRAFHMLKQRLISAPVLAMPNPQRPFTVSVDASDTAVGAVLEQDGHPVAYFSKRLSSAEENYNIRDKELAAQVFALRHWRCYLAAGLPFVVITDHHSLTSFSQQELSSGRLARWASMLQDYEYSVQYRRGQDNVADALSRRDAGVREGEEAKASGVNPVAQQHSASATLAELGKGLRERYSASEDGYFNTVVQGLHDPATRASLSRAWQRRLQRFVVLEDALYLQEEDGRRRLCVPYAARAKLMAEFHDGAVGGHAGVGKTYQLMRVSFFWPNMVGDIARYIAHCDPCVRNKSSTTPYHVPAQPLEAPSRPWEAVALDFMDLPMSSSGHDSALTVTDLFSGMVHVVPTTRTVTAAGAVDLLIQHVVRLHGVPCSLVSDRDVRFTSELWRVFWRRLNTRLRMTTAHRPQGDGRSERSNRTVQTTLRHFVNASGSDWDQAAVLALAELGLNMAINPTTGVSPFQVQQGWQPLIPATMSQPRAVFPRPTGETVAERNRDMQLLWERISTAIADAQARQIQQAAARSPAAAERAPEAPQVGDLVMLHTRNYPTLRKTKLHAPWVGPFKVLARSSPAVATLDLPPTMRIHPTVNLDALRPYTADPKTRPPPGPVGTAESGEALWEIEKIVDSRVRGRTKQYKVQWKGYGEEHDSWEPASELKIFPDLIRAFERFRPPA
jgi:hypothetical protein